MKIIYKLQQNLKKKHPLNQRYKSCRCSNAAAAAPAAAAADGPEAIGAPINATTKNKSYTYTCTL